MYKLFKNKLFIEFIDVMLSYNLFENYSFDWYLESGELVEGGMGVVFIKYYFLNVKYILEKYKNIFLFYLLNIDKWLILIYIDDDKF